MKMLIAALVVLLLYVPCSRGEFPEAQSIPEEVRTLIALALDSGSAYELDEAIARLQETRQQRSGDIVRTQRDRNRIEQALQFANRWQSYLFSIEDGENAKALSEINSILNSDRRLIALVAGPEGVEKIRSRREAIEAEQLAAFSNLFASLRSAILNENTTSAEMEKFSESLQELRTTRHGQSTPRLNRANTRLDSSQQLIDAWSQVLQAREEGDADTIAREISSLRNRSWSNAGIVSPSELRNLLRQMRADTMESRFLEPLRNATLESLPELVKELDPSDAGFSSSVRERHGQLLSILNRLVNANMLIDQGLGQEGIQMVRWMHVDKKDDFEIAHRLRTMLEWKFFANELGVELDQSLPPKQALRDVVAKAVADKNWELCLKAMTLQTSSGIPPFDFNNQSMESIKSWAAALDLHEAGLYADARAAYIVALKNSSEFIPRETILEKLKQLHAEETAAKSTEP